MRLKILTKLKTTLVAYVDGSNIIIMHLALVGVNKLRERTCFILFKRNVACNIHLTMIVQEIA